MPRRDDDFDREILDIIPERFDADADSSMARRNARTRLLVTISLAVLAVMAVGIAARHILFGESSTQQRQASVPVIHADDKPIKVKPTDRGGMDVPNQDKTIYDQMAGKAPSSQAERLLPPPEQAQTPPPAAVAPTPAPAPAVSDQMPPKAAATAPAAPPPAALPPPAKVTTAAPSPVAPPKTAPAAPASTPAVKGGGWVVQLGAVKSEAEANAEWKRLKAAHAEQLGDLQPDIMRVDLGAKGIFWRVRGVPLDEAQARLLCSELTKQSQGCIIARK